MRFRLLRRSSKPAPMACQELVELVTDYLEGALTDTDVARFEAHIADCPHCTNYLEQIRITVRVAGELREEHIEPRAREELLVAFRTWKTEG